MLPDSIGIVTACPEVAAPEQLFDFGAMEKYLFGSDRFDYGDYPRDRQCGDTLDEEVDMVLVGTDFNKKDLMGLADGKTGLAKNFRYVG